MDLLLHVSIAELTYKHRDIFTKTYVVTDFFAFRCCGGSRSGLIDILMSNPTQADLAPKPVVTTFCCRTSTPVFFFGVPSQHGVVW